MTTVAAARGSRLDIAVLRVLAIVAVMLIHVTGLTFANHALRGTAVWWLATAVNSASRFSVPMFVLVSGALTLRPGSTEAPRVFVRRRLERLLPALVFWYAVYSVFQNVVLHAHRGVLTSLALALAGRTYTALYFFWLILGLYLATPALRKLLAGLSQVEVLRAGVGLTALTCAWETTTTFIDRYTAVDVSAPPTAFTNWLPYVGFFVLGGALAQRPVPRRVVPIAAAVFVVSSAATVWVTSGHAPSLLSYVATSSYQSWSVALATVSLFLIVAGLLPDATAVPAPLVRVVETMGGLTLGVFASHLLVLYALQHAGLLSVVHGASRLIELGYLSVATIMLAFGLTWVASKVPVARRLV